MVITATNQECATLDDVAAELGVSRERARQIEQSAFAKIRRGLALRGYRIEDLIDITEKRHRNGYRIPQHI